MISASRVFQQLRAELSEGRFSPTEGRSSGFPIGNTGGRIEAFADQSGHIGLFVPFGESDKNFRADVRSKDLTLKKITRDGSPKAELRLANAGLSSVFYPFVDTFLKELALDPESAVSQLSRQLAKWRSLFVSSPSGTLSPQKEIGLICELQVLQEQLLDRGDEAFLRWTGPDASRHDFQFDDLDLECKAVTSLNGLTVHINGIHQLTPSSKRPLVLLVRRYERTPNGQVSLVRLVNELIENDEVSTTDFLKKLNELGFRLQDQSGDTQNRYRLIEEFTFEIGDGFPHLDPHELPNRLVSAIYQIDLNPPNEIPGFIGERTFQ